MKSSLYLLLGSLVLNACTINIPVDSGSVYYSKNTSKDQKNLKTQPMVIKSFSVGDFSKVEASAAMRFFIKKADENRVEINSNAMEYIEVTNHHQMLNVKYKTDKELVNLRTEVTVYMKDLQNLEASAAALVVVKDTFNSEKLSVDLNSASQLIGNLSAKTLNIEISSAAKLNANIECQTLDIEATSSSYSRLSGNAEKVKAEASTAAKIDLKNLKYQNINTETFSSGKVIKS